MMDWMRNREVRDILLLLGAAGLIVFLLLVYVFAFYW